MGTIGGPLYLPRFGEGGPPSSTEGSHLLLLRDSTLVGSSAWHRSNSERRSDRCRQRGHSSRPPVNFPQVRALLDFLPAAATPLESNRQVWTQWSNVHRSGWIVDRFTVVNLRRLADLNPHRSSLQLITTRLNGRYLYQDSGAFGSIPGVAASQITPGLLVRRSGAHQGVNLQFRVCSRRSGSTKFAALSCAVRQRNEPAGSRSLLIPSIEVVELGLRQIQRCSHSHGDRTGREPAAEPGEKHLPVARQHHLHQRTTTHGSLASTFAATSFINFSNQPHADCSNTRPSTIS